MSLRNASVSDMTNRTTAAGVNVIDLFAGAGGLGIGAEQAGASVRLSVELDETSCSTLEINKSSIASQVLIADVTDVSGEQLRTEAGLTRSDELVVVGGPPCQPFSKAAYWTEEGNDAAYRRARANGEKGLTKPPAPEHARQDDRRSLVEHFSRLVIESKADGFVFENVPAIAHPRNLPILDGLVSELRDDGFQITVTKLNAVAFGVAQKRERIFVLGSRAGAPEPPEPTHMTAAGRGESEDLLPMPTAKAACKPFRSEAFHEPEEIVVGRWADHLHTVPPGGNYKAHTEWGGHPNPTFVTETRFWNFLLKLHPDLPSWTIAATPGPWTGPFHWESRRLRVPELAALQGFPATYKFAGSRREQVRQIGNAVAPPIAAHAVRSVLDTFTK